MRHLLNPNWFRSGRTAITVSAIVLVLTLALGASWSAGAFRDSPPAQAIFPIKPKLADDRSREAFDEYARRILRLRASAGDDLLEELLPKKGRGRKFRPFVVAAAVGDGKIVYAKTTRTVTERDLILGLGSLPMEIVSRDLASGAEAAIFKSRSALIGGLMTRGGVTVFGVGRFSATRRGVAIDSSVLHHAAGAEGAKVVASDSIDLNIGGFTYCGRSLTNSNVDPAGNVLLISMTATCGKSNELSYSTQVVAPDGSVKDFDSGAVGGVFVGGISDYSNGRLLGNSFTSGAFGVQEPAPGVFTPLISGNVAASALAEDGTAAAVIRNFRGEFPFGKGSADPFVVFPKGDPDRIVVASRSAGKIKTLAFCGTNLYAIKQLTSPKRSFGEFEDGLSFEWSDRARAKYRVLQYRSDGSFVKAFGDTPNMELVASGCDGQSLALVAARSDDVTLLRYTP